MAGWLAGALQGLATAQMLRGEWLRRELRATGQATLRVSEPGPLARLTPQEFQIARMAAAGVSNRDIAAQLFLSHRTVAYHLYEAYPKLDITSRTELAGFFGPAHDTRV